MINMSQRIGACIIILDVTNTKVLLGKRINDYKSGFYGLPAGCLKDKEQFRDCAKRELREETGLDAVNLEYLGEIREHDVNGSFLHVAYKCNKHEGKLTLKEPDKCEKWEFHSLDNLPANLIVEHKIAIEMAIGKKELLF